MKNVPKNDKFIVSGSTMICINQYHPVACSSFFPVMEENLRPPKRHSGGLISNGNPPFPIGNTSSNGGFSIAMLVYQRVTWNLRIYPWNFGKSSSKASWLQVLCENLRGGVSNIPISTTHIKYTNIKDTFFQLYLPNRYPKYMHLYIYLHINTLSHKSGRSDSQRFFEASASAPCLATRPRGAATGREISGMG